MKNTDGSALVIVIVFMSLLSLFCITFWQSSSLFHDISLQCLAYEQKSRAAQGGLNYAIALCRKNFDAIIKICKETGQAYQIETEPWQIAKNIVYRCNVTVTSIGDALCMTSRLFDDDKKNVFSVSCHLFKNQNNFFIRRWSIDE